MAEEIRFPRTQPDWDSEHLMRALEWQGKKDVKVVERFKPKVTETKDALIRITSTTICGSDLHLYHNELPGMEKGDILGHEFMGFVEDVGSEVERFKKGDRVVVSAIISCGQCSYCLQGFTSSCDCTNPSKEMEKLYGHRTSGLFGYSHLTGGYPGGQAEYCRVPLADYNLLKVPEHLPDEKVLFLSDIVCTGYHATELANVQEGDTVAVWGVGPVGLMALAWAKFKGAKKLIAIDGVSVRLQLAKHNLGAEIIDFSKEDVLSELKQIVPGGPDCCIDAVGFRFPKGLLHKVQRAIYAETDTPEVLAEAIRSVRKAGKIGVVGDYFSYANRFPIGAFMEKGLSMSGGQVQVQKYWEKLLQYIEEGSFDPTFVITHTIPFEDADHAYGMFDRKEDGAIKIVLKTRAARATG